MTESPKDAITSGSPPRGSSRPRATALLGLAGMGLVLLLGYTAYRNFVAAPDPEALRGKTPALISDEIDVAGLDPAVARLITKTMDELNGARESGASWGKLASVLMHYEFFDQSRFAFEQAEKLSPQDARWPYLHALLLMNSAPEIALTNLQRAVELAPRQPDVPRVRLAQFLAERGRYDDAETHFHKLLQQTPAHPLALLGLARLSHQRGRFVESSNLLSRCLQDTHTAKSAHALLASVQRALGDAAAAEAAAERSASLPADAPWPDPFWDEAANYRVGRKAFIEDATGLMDQGRIAEALPLLASVTGEYPDDEEGWYLLGWAYNQQQQAPQAERALREHLRRSPRSPKGHAQLAVALLTQKQFAEAVDVLKAGVQLKPTWRELHYNLGYASAQLGRTNEAISDLRKALECDPNYVPTYIALAELLARQAEKDEPERLLLQALNLSPSDARANALLMRLRETP